MTICTVTTARVVSAAMAVMFTGDRKEALYLHSPSKEEAQELEGRGNTFAQSLACYFSG